MALRTSGRRSRSLSRRISLSRQFPKVAPQLVERGTGSPRLLQVEPGRQSRLIDRRAVVLSRDHAASLEKFLGPANRFSVWRRRRIVHDAPIAAERADGAKKPGFVLGLGEYHADRNRPGAPPHSLQQRRRPATTASSPRRCPVPNRPSPNRRSRSDPKADLPRSGPSTGRRRRWCRRPRCCGPCAR